MMTKACKKCGEEKLLTDFYVAPDCADGRRGSCKRCHNIAAATHYQKNSSRICATVKAYQKNNADHIRDAQRTRYAKNRDRVLARVKKWVEANRAHRDAYLRERYVANREKILARIREQRRLNPEKTSVQRAKRRAAELRATPCWADHAKIASVYRVAKETGLVVDHIVPLRSKHVSGLHVVANLQPLSREENAAKGNRWWPDMWEQNHAST